MIKFNLNLKDPHLEVINDLKAKFSITSNKEMINRCITSALNLNKDDLIFSTIKEKCSGGCFASEPQFEIEMNKDTFIQLKKIYTENDFDNYKTEEEEVGKVIRCIINFFEDEPDLITF
ncbi:MAG: hypothetical protein CFH34_00920 [Alphaproteobacteria bacterium MarineAlpha9_Bin4]|nr:MAG: hypothetical protein CFH34_00920 [Alphaproteobacteria bacterium MarineAlpha9_Bin4]|tara:strand:+ start:130 stop:486 length:357 start_codon:yes stop_codon:yes gene_type:complete